MKTLRPTFTWNAPANTSLLDHYVLFYQGGGSSYDVTIDKALTSWTPTTDLADGSYSWHVRAEDSYDNWLGRSNLVSFTIDTTPSGSGHSGSRAGGFYRPSIVETPVASTVPGLEELLSAILKSANSLFTTYLALPADEQAPYASQVNALVGNLMTLISSLQLGK